MNKYYHKREYKRKETKAMKNHSASKKSGEGEKED